MAPIIHHSTTPQALRNAAEALQRGDKRAARHWAQLAAAQAPQNEEAWLILAAVSSPQASIEYLKQALLVHPGSERAMSGLRWAQARLAKQPPLPKAASPLVVTQPTRLSPGPQTSRPLVATQPIRHHAAAKAGLPLLRLIPIATGIVLLMCMVLLWFAWPGNVSAALGLVRSENMTSAGEPSWAFAAIAKSTYTPTATATLLPTSTPIPTATPLPTDAPTPTALPTDTAGWVPAAQPAPANNGKYILVSISEQHLYAYQDGLLAYSAVASTGMNRSTRIGVFQVLDKIPNAYGATWNIWMPNWLGIYYSGSLENGIHALPILPNGARLWAGYLGTPISFGCVVLGVEESQWIYDWAEVGTTVEIRY